jgi:two-component system, chemotaxis family, response regulator Rcp1
MLNDKRLTPIEILLVEDSPSDVLMVRESLGKLLNSLHVVEDGVEAMAFVRRQGKYADKPRPHLILLDLNLPRKDGREVLAEIKSDPDLATIPVIVLTTSSAEEDIVTSYGLHANSFVTKPVEYPNFLAAIRSLENFWLTIVTLPAAA